MTFVYKIWGTVTSFIHCRLCPTKWVAHLPDGTWYCINCGKNFLPPSKTKG